jgi:hypothetical protein
MSGGFASRFLRAHCNCFNGSALSAFIARQPTSIQHGRISSLRPLNAHQINSRNFTVSRSACTSKESNQLAVGKRTSDKSAKVAGAPSGKNDPLAAAQNGRLTEKLRMLFLEYGKVGTGEIGCVFSTT